jgi:hypothetical protein
MFTILRLTDSELPHANVERVTDAMQKGDSLLTTKQNRRMQRQPEVQASSLWALRPTVPPTCRYAVRFQPCILEVLVLVRNSKFLHSRSTRS